MLLKQFKTFVSVLKIGVILISCTGVAFLLIAPEEFPEKAECEEFFKKIEKFVQVHRNSFLLLQAPAYGARELEIVSAVQNRCIYNLTSILKTVLY